MSNSLQIIGDHLRSGQTFKRMALSLGLKTENPNDLTIIQEYASSVLMEIEKSVGDQKKDLTRCTPESIVQCMIDSAKFGIKIDGRQHAHLVKYGNKATLQIGYRGFIAKIREAIPTSDINAFPAYTGDDLSISGEDGFDSYTHTRANPFAPDSDLIGVVGVLYYKKDGKEFQRVITMSKDEIEKVKGVAKQTFIWDTWYIEKAKVAVIKRLCKMTFAGISEIQDLVDYDNREHFTIDGEKPAVDKTAQLDEFTQKALENKPTDKGDDEPITIHVEADEKPEQKAVEEKPTCETCNGTKVKKTNEGQDGETIEPCPTCNKQQGDLL